MGNKSDSWDTDSGFEIHIKPARIGKFLSIVAVIGLACALGGKMYLGYRDKNPDIQIPSPVMSNPNAYDAFADAANAVVDSNKVSYAGVLKPVHSEYVPDSRVYTLAEKTALLAENAPAFAKLRAGFNLPYQPPPGHSFSDSYETLAHMRQLPRLLTLEGRVRADRGDWAGLINSNLDSMRLGEILPHNGGVMDRIVGRFGVDIGRQGIWEAVDHLDAHAARDAANQLEKICANHEPYWMTVQEDKWATQRGLMEEFHKPDWQKFFADILRANSAPDVLDSAGMRMARQRLMFVTKRQIMTNYTAYMDKMIANARRPYTAKPPEPPKPADPVSAALLAGMVGSDTYKYWDAYEETLNSLLLTTLALRAYRLDNGSLPKTLPELVPRYLTAVPEDLFALNAPLQYRPTGTTFALYSVGPDGIDDGGIPAVNKAIHSKKPNYRIGPDDPGDIVAGVNK